MDERKRERSHVENSEPKRFRPEEIIGPGDNGRVITRLLVNKDEFSRLIGKGGATISLIRNSTGVNLKGTDVDEDHRLVLISGYLDAVIKAFELVSELLEQSARHSSDGGGAESESSRGVFAVHILLEHGKAGKAVGAKGAMMENIKRKSAVQSLRIEKEPKDFSGVLLRNLTVGGSLASIRRAHYHLLELFYSGNGANFSQQGVNGFGSAAGYGSLEFSGSAAAAAAAQHNFSSGGGSYIAPVLNLRQASQQQHLLGSMGGSVAVSAIVPFPSLIEVGVQPETVRQLEEMQGYLRRHFNLNLCCTREEPPGAVSATTMHLPSSASSSANMRHQHVVTIDAALSAKREASANKVLKNAAEGNAVQEVSFAIPKSIAGGLIGKGAQGIKDLQQEFEGARVHVEREEIEEQRIVVLYHQQLASDLAEGAHLLPSDQVSSLLDNLKTKILANVDALLEEQQQQLQQAAGSGSMEA